MQFCFPLHLTFYMIGAVHMQNVKSALTTENIMALLDKLYQGCLNGVPRVSPSIDKLAEDYIGKTDSIEKAARQFTNYQITKCTTSGFLTGLGGLITLPIAIPANISSVLYVQMRMVAGLAYMGGFDLKSDQVQTLVYACLAGVSLNQIVKQAGIKFGTKFANSMIKKIPGTVLTKINQKVGFRFITKFGTKGLINLGKAVPIVGGLIGGCIDLAETKAIAHRSYKLFIERNSSSLSDSDSIADYTDSDFTENDVKQ